MTIHSHRVPTRLGTMHVRDSGTGPATVLWPSMFVDGTTWNRVLPLLPTDRRYLIVDGPGLGLSAPLTQPADILQASYAAEDLLDALGLTSPVDWVGNAFGGHVGYELAARGRLTSLVTISAPAEGISRGLRAKINLLLPLARTFGPRGPVRDAIIQAMLTDASAARPDLRAVVVSSLHRPTAASLVMAIRSFILNRVDVRSKLGAISIPALFVASDDRGDWTPEAARADAALTPNAQVIVVERARTLIPLEQPEVLARSIIDFWESLEPTTEQPTRQPTQKRV